MAFQINSVFAPFPPSRDTGAYNHRFPENLSGTGTTESSTSRKFESGSCYTVYAGAAPIRLAFHFARGLAAAVDPALDLIVVPAYGSFTFTAWGDAATSVGAYYLYIEAADGVAAYTAQVWHSGN